MQFNAYLMNKHKKEDKENNIEMLLASDASLAQDWNVENHKVE